MRHAGLLLAGLLLLAGCGGPDQPAASATTSTAATSAPATGTPATVAAPAAQSAASARYDGYGATRFGMDEAAFRQAWAGGLNGTPQPGAECFYLRPKWAKLPGELAFMFEHGRFVRYEVGTAKEAAPGGGAVGMDEARIRRLYGDRVAEQPHKYLAGAKYLRVAATAGKGVLLFETDAAGKVTRWRAGVPPQVDYVEGCS